MVKGQGPACVPSASSNAFSVIIKSPPPAYSPSFNLTFVKLALFLTMLSLDGGMMELVPKPMFSIVRLIEGGRFLSLPPFSRLPSCDRELFFVRVFYKGGSLFVLLIGISFSSSLLKC